MSHSQAPGLTSAKPFEPLNPLPESSEAADAFRGRIEFNAQRYLDGHPLFIASAFSTGGWASALTRDRPFIVSPARTQRTRPWYAKPWLRLASARSSHNGDDNARRRRPSTPKPRPSSCYRPYRESQGPPALFAHDLDAQQSAFAKKLHESNATPHKTPQEQYCDKWLTNGANDPTTTYAAEPDNRSASSPPSPSVHDYVTARQVTRNVAVKPRSNTRDTANHVVGLPHAVVSEEAIIDPVENRPNQKPRVPSLVSTEVEVVSIASHTEDNDRDLQQPVPTPNTSDRASARSVIEIDSDSGRVMTPAGPSDTYDEALGMVEPVKETDVVIQDQQIDDARSPVVEQATGLDKVTLPVHQGISLERSEALARPHSVRHTSTEADQSRSVAANQSKISTSHKDRSVHEQAISHTNQLPTIPETVAKPRPTFKGSRSNDQGSVQNHAERAPSEQSTAHVLVCKECKVRNPSRLVKSVHGPKTVCDKCGYRLRRENKIQTEVNARMALARPSEPRPMRQTAYRGNPYEDASADMSGRPRRQRNSRTNTDVNDIAHLEDPFTNYGLQTAQPLRRPRRGAKDRRSDQTEVRTPVAGRPLKTPHATLMKQMFANTPLQELQRNNNWAEGLLGDESKLYFRDLLKKPVSSNSVPDFEAEGNMVSVPDHAGASAGATKSPQPAPANLRKRRRMMTFDTPVLGQPSKRPRMSEDEVSEPRRYVQDEPKDTRPDSAIARDPEDEAPANSGPSEPRDDPSHAPHRADFKKPALPTPVTDTEHMDQASPSVRMRSETPLPQRTALIEQSTNKILTPKSSGKLKATLRKLADRVEVSASPIRPTARTNISFDGAADTENRHSESQYISTQTAMNFAFQDFQQGLESPEKRSPIKQNQMKPKPHTSWHDDLPSSSTDKIISSAIRETPVSAPMNTQAIFDQYRFTPFTPGSSPLQSRGRSTQTPIITPSTTGTSASVSSGRLKPVVSRSRSRPRTSLSNMMNARSSSPPKSLSQILNQDAMDMDTFHIDSFLDDTVAELAA